MIDVTLSMYSISHVWFLWLSQTMKYSTGNSKQPRQKDDRFSQGIPIFTQERSDERNTKKVHAIYVKQFLSPLYKSMLHKHYIMSKVLMLNVYFISFVFHWSCFLHIEIKCTFYCGLCLQQGEGYLEVLTNAYMKHSPSPPVDKQKGGSQREITRHTKTQTRLTPILYVLPVVILLLSLVVDEGGCWNIFDEKHLVS